MGRTATAMGTAQSLSVIRRRAAAYKKRRILLNPKAVEAFYHRKLDDWRWLKEVPRGELEKLVPEGFSFATEPRLHQLACFLLGVKFEQFLFFLDMGSGKSKLLLDLIRYRKWRGELKSALICVPNLINFYSWRDQLELHAPDLSFTILAGDKLQRYSALAEGNLPDVCIINYAGLPVYMADSYRRTRKGRSKRQMVVEEAEAFSDIFNFIALDECHIGLSTVRSLEYQLTKHLCWHAQCAYAATGTPMGNDPIKFWPQFHVVDRGETLGHSLAMFRAAYYREKPHFFAGVQYQFEKRKRMHLNATMQHRSIRYQDKELADLPKRMPSVIVHCPMSDAQLRFNSDLIEQARLARLGGEKPPAVFIKQRQAAAGFINLKAEDQGQKLEFEFRPNPKMLALEGLLEQLPEEEKVVIFHDFIHSGLFITEVLRKLKMEFSGVGHGYKHPDAERQRFLKEKRCRAFVANCRAGGTGVDGLQHVSHYAIFYESPTSPTLRRQAEKRIDRDGQRHRCYYYDLVAQGINIDQRILNSIASGVDLFEAVMNGKEKIT